MNSIQSSTPNYGGSLVPSRTSLSLGITCTIQKVAAAALGTYLLCQSNTHPEALKLNAVKFIQTHQDRVPPLKAHLEITLPDSLVLNHQEERMKQMNLKDGAVSKLREWLQINQTLEALKEDREIYVQKIEQPIIADEERRDFIPPWTAVVVSSIGLLYQIGVGLVSFIKNKKEPLEEQINTLCAQTLDIHEKTPQESQKLEVDDLIFLQERAGTRPVQV